MCSVPKNTRFFFSLRAGTRVCRQVLANTSNGILRLEIRPHNTHTQRIALQQLLDLKTLIDLSSTRNTYKYSRETVTAAYRKELI